MSVNEKYIPAAVSRLEARRSRNESLQIQRRNEILQKIPEYGELSVKLSGTMSRVVEALAAGRSDAPDIARKAAEENLALQKKIAELLVKNGYPQNYLEPVYDCPLCRDKGTIDGKWCSCVEKITCSLAAEELNKRSPLVPCSFESFDLSLYPASVDKVFGRPQNEMMEQNLEICREYAENPKGCLFMIGATGLGKTHLSLAVAKRVIEKGMSVVYNSVPDLLRTINDENFRNADGDVMQVIFDCDLLILDDLGAENSSDYTTSVLYQIINSRTSRAMPMIVNTNLDVQQIKSRYQDRITSRLFSQRVLFFCGEDNRLKLAKK